MKIASETTKATPQKVTLLKKNITRPKVVFCVSLLFSIVFSAIFAFSFPSLAVAHDVIPGTWLFVNNQDLLTYNDSLSNAKLEVAERKLKNSLDPGEEYEFRINVPAFASKFELEQEQITAAWTLDQVLIETAPSHTFTFSETGSHYLDVRILNRTSSKELFADSVVVQVGESQTEGFPTILVNGNEYNFSDNGDKILVDSDTLLKTEIRGEKLANFSYTWDLGGLMTEENTASKNYRTATLPSYILLRATEKSTQIYTDFYLEITTENPENLGDSIPRQAVIKSDEQKNSNQATALPVIGIITFVSFLGLGYSLFRKKLVAGAGFEPATSRL